MLATASLAAAPVTLPHAAAATAAIGRGAPQAGAGLAESIFASLVGGMTDGGTVPHTSASSPPAPAVVEVSAALPGPAKPAATPAPARVAAVPAKSARAMPEPMPEVPAKISHGDTGQTPAGPAPSALPDIAPPAPTPAPALSAAPTPAPAATLSPAPVPAASVPAHGMLPRPVDAPATVAGAVSLPRQAGPPVVAPLGGPPATPARSVALPAMAPGAPGPAAIRTAPPAGADPRQTAVTASAPLVRGANPRPLPARRMPDGTEVAGPTAVDTAPAAVAGAPAAEGGTGLALTSPPALPAKAPDTGPPAVSSAPIVDMPRPATLGANDVAARPAAPAAEPDGPRPVLASAAPSPEPHLAPAATQPDAATAPALPFTAHLVAASPPAPAAPAGFTPLPSPQTQVIGAAVHLLSGGTGHQVTIALRPRELGRVEVNIERHTSGGASVAVAVERPETLELLRHDMPQLQSALERAGLSVASGDLTLHLKAPAAQSAETAQAVAAVPLPERGGIAQSAAAGGQAPADGQRSQGQFQGQSQGHRRDGAAAWTADAGAPGGTSDVADGMPARDGLDITA